MNVYKVRVEDGQVSPYRYVIADTYEDVLAVLREHRIEAVASIESLGPALQRKPV
jgi:hypothetical protein